MAPPGSKCTSGGPFTLSYPTYTAGSSVMLILSLCNSRIYL